MQLWTVHSAAAQPESMLASLVGCIGQPDFGREALATLNLAVPVASWSIYRVFADQPPSMYASGSFEIPDTTQECFRIYRAGLYRRDATFEQARECTQPGAPVMTHWAASEIRGPHRQQIYQRHGMRERLSVISADDPEGLLSVNLYRHDHQGSFRDSEIDRVQQFARILIACVRRHVQLSGSVATADPVAALRQRCPGLTERELQVCERLLRGWTHDGIAADLDLSVTTVKTYRNRAFERLGIHFRNELFSLVR